MTIPRVADPKVGIYVINLARRADRRERMTTLLARQGLQAQFVPAIDAQTVSPAQLRPHFSSRMPLGPLSLGDQCCSLSHRKAWAMLAASQYDWGVVLEDDVVLHEDFAAVLAAISVVPAEIGLIKLERCTYSNRALLAPAEPQTLFGYRLHHLVSRHICAAGYMLRRSVVSDALTKTEIFSVPVDHFLFNPGITPKKRRLEPFQLYPAVVEQLADANGKNANSDIRTWRRLARPKGLGLFRRELWRVITDVSALPGMWLNMAKGARFVSIRLGNDHKRGV